MSHRDTKYLEMQLNAKQLRVKIIRHAITLGLTLVNLAKAEDSIGNMAQARWASENAKKVYEEVMDCLPNTQLSKEDTQSVQEMLKELEKAIN